MRERVSLRKKPCPPALFQLRRVNISELNQRGGQIQIQFFGKANGGFRQRRTGCSNFFRRIETLKKIAKGLNVSVTCPLLER
jgi:hypothetical protein